MSSDSLTSLTDGGEPVERGIMLGDHEHDFIVGPDKRRCAERLGQDRRHWQMADEMAIRNIEAWSFVAGPWTASAALNILVSSASTSD